ncbi:MAG: AAA family ATPase [Nitrososphaeria archaeon]
MVHILRLEIRGFKSFRERTVLEFSEGLNAITGRNGSGKSNIVDAIRFALGSNSPKALRESRMSRLISEGSRIRMARVSITLSNEDGVLPVSSDKVTITRELLEDGTQRYYLNGRRTTRSAVEDFLAAAGISADGLNIVPQGSLNAVAEMSPNERMELLQEIIGIRVYDEKKEEALQRLRSADEQLAVTFAKMDEKREIMVKLEKEMNELLRLRQIDQELMKYRKAILLRRLDELEGRRSELARSIDEAQRRGEELSRELDDVLRLFEGGERAREVYNRYAEIMARLQSLASELRLLDSRLEEDGAELQRAKEALSNVERIAENLTVQRRSIEQSLSSRRAELQGLEGEISELRERESLIEKRIEEVRRAEDERRRLIQRLSGALERLTNARLRIEEALDFIRDAVSSERRKLEALEGIAARHEEIKRRLEALGNRESTDVSRYAERLEELRRRRQEILREIMEANEVLLRAMGYSVAQRILRSHATGDVLNEILEEGAVEGYLGRLSDLIRPRQGYERMVSAAIEYVKDPLVFQEASSAALRFLKSSSRRRAVFINEVRPERPCERSVAGLMEYPEEMKNVIAAIFGKICYEEDECCEAVVLKDGTVLSRGIYEIGQIGSTQTSLREYLEKISRVRSGVDRLLDLINRRIEEISRISGEILELRQSAAEAAGSRLSREQIEELERLLQEEESALSGYRMELSELRQRLNERISEMERYERALKGIDRRISQIKERLQSVSRQGESAEELERELMEVRRKIAELSSRADRLRVEIAELESSLKGIDDRISVAISSRTELERRIGSLSSEISSLRERREEIEKERASLQEQADSMKENVELASRAQESREELSRKKDALLREIRENNRRIEKLRIEAERLEEQEREIREQVEGMKVEPYELLGGYEEVMRGLERERAELEARVNRMAERDYSEYYRSYKEVSSRRNELERDRDAIVRFIEDIEKQKKDAFMKAFSAINDGLREIFSQIVDGDAWLELESPENPFSGGVFLIGRFGDKQPRESASLSGGEKAVLSVSFLMAIQKYYPAKFYIFDEIDANLDADRAERLGEFLRKWSASSQVILVSLKDTMISKADRVFGVYEKNGSSYVVPLEMSRVVGHS